MTADHDTAPLTPNPHPDSALRYRDFVLVVFNQTALMMGIGIQELVIGYKLYELTRDPLSLGFVGLAAALPYLVLSIWGGYLADRLNRQRIMQVCVVLFVPLPILLYQLVAHYEQGLLTLTQLKIGIYSVIFLLGLIRGFYNPAASSLFPFLLPRHLYANGAAWRAMAVQAAIVTGPVLGGLLYAWQGLKVTLISVGGFFGLCSLLLLLLQKRQFPDVPPGNVVSNLADGFRFVWRTPVVFWSVSLDMVSVLFGGVMAILPIFAMDILSIGVQGLGWLRAAPAVGGLLMVIWLTRHPPVKQAWRNMLLAVAGFGLFTLVFALSKHLWLSLIALALTGACDSVSVVIRQTLIQWFTPDELRGRVAAVNGMFITTSNELGAFESGLAARLLGTVPSVVMGGLLTLGVVGLTWTRTQPLLRLRIQSETDQPR